MSNHTPVIDQADDLNGQHLHRICQDYGIEDPFKNSPAEARVGAHTNSRIYGAPHLRKFSCQTAPSTFLSALFFLDQKEAFDSETAGLVWDKISKCAEYHGVQGHVKAAQAAIEAAKSYELPDSDYGLVWEENGLKKRAYPISSLEELTKAAEYFHSNRRDFPYADRRAFAQKILEKSAAYNIEPRYYDEICKSAGMATGTCQNAIDVLMQRAKELALSEELKKEAHVLATAAAALSEDPTAAHRPKVLAKLASILDGINRKNSSLHPRELPEDQLFTITEKTAEENLANRVVLANGAIFHLRPLAEIPIQKIASVMGEEFTSTISVGGGWLDMDSMADVLPTMDKDMANVFTKAAEAASVMPERYSQGRLRFSPEVLKELATR